MELKDFEKLVKRVRENRKTAIPVLAGFLFVGGVVVLSQGYLTEVGKRLATPETPNTALVPDSRSELIAVLNSRAQSVLEKLDSDIQGVEAAATAFSGLTEDRPGEVTEAVLRETGEITEELRGIRDSFEKLHAEHIDAIQKEQRILAREISRKIGKLLRTRYGSLTTRNVGIDSNGDILVYQQGIEKVLVDVKRITNSETPMEDRYPDLN